MGACDRRTAHLKLNDCSAAPNMVIDKMAEEMHQVHGSPPNFLARIHLHPKSHVQQRSFLTQPVWPVSPLRV